VYRLSGRAARDPRSRGEPTIHSLFRAVIILPSYRWLRHNVSDASARRIDLWRHVVSSPGGRKPPWIGAYGRHLIDRRCKMITVLNRYIKTQTYIHTQTQTIHTRKWLDSTPPPRALVKNEAPDSLTRLVGCRERDAVRQGEAVDRATQNKQTKQHTPAGPFGGRLHIHHMITGG
jgi:hypothetical protein